MIKFLKLNLLQASKDNLEFALVTNDFEQFKKQLKKQPKLNESNLRTLKMILNSKNQSAPKFVSLFFEICLELQTEDFWKSSESLELMRAAAKSEILEIFFSFLMFDWFQPSSKNSKKYCLAAKSELFLKATGENLSEKLYKIIDARKTHRDICLRICYCFYEAVSEEKDEEKDEFCLKNLFLMRNLDCRDRLLEVSVAYQNAKDVNFVAKMSKILCHADSEETKNFIVLMKLLKERKVIKFQQMFEDFFVTFEKKYGNFFEYALKLQLRLLHATAIKQGLRKSADFIASKCPNVSCYTTMKKIIDEIGNHQIFIASPFKSSEMNSTVRSNEIT